METDVQQPQQQTPQHVSPQELHQEMSHSSLPKVLWIILGVIIVLGLIGGAYYLGTKQKDNVVYVSGKNMATVSPAGTNLQTKTPSPTQNPTANWQTLHNTNGFSISYPSSFTPHGVGMVDDPVNSPEVMVGDTVKRNDAPFIEISAYDQKNIIKTGGNLEGVRMPDYNGNVQNKNTYISTIVAPHALTVGGKNAYEFIINSKGFSGSGEGWTNGSPARAEILHVLEVENNGKYYTFVYQDDKTLQQIIDTLQFP